MMILTRKKRSLKIIILNLGNRGLFPCLNSSSKNEGGGGGGGVGKFETVITFVVLPTSDVFK